MISDEAMENGALGVDCALNLPLGNMKCLEFVAYRKAYDERGKARDGFDKFKPSHKTTI